MRAQQGNRRRPKPGNDSDLGLNSTLEGDETTNKDGNVDPKRPRKASRGTTTTVERADAAENNRNDVSVEAPTTEILETGELTGSSLGNDNETSDDDVGGEICQEATETEATGYAGEQLGSLERPIQEQRDDDDEEDDDSGVEIPINMEQHVEKVRHWVTLIWGMEKCTEISGLNCLCFVQNYKQGGNDSGKEIPIMSTVEEEQKERIEELTRVIHELEKSKQAVSLETGAFSINVGEDQGPTGREGNDRQKVGDTADTEVSSLGTAVTTNTMGLLKDNHFTSFCNKRVFRYCKYWWSTRDSPTNSELAGFFRAHWWGDYQRREMGSHPCFDKWWTENGMYIRQKLSLKRTNNISQLRKIFKGMYFGVWD
jgi:hypothetical protein